MACKVVKKILGYELCVFEKEGTLFHMDQIVVIRKQQFTEIYNLQTHEHETGDIIEKEITRKAVYSFIEENKDLFI